MGQLSYNAARSRTDVIASIRNVEVNLTLAIAAGEQAQCIYPEYEPSDLITLRKTIRAFLRDVT